MQDHRQRATITVNNAQTTAGGAIGGGKNERFRILRERCFVEDHLLEDAVVGGVADEDAAE